MNKDRLLTIGIIMDKRGDPPYVSVNKLWKETTDIISDSFNTEVLEVDSFFIENNDEYRRFVDKIDLLFMMSPYYTIDRNYKKFPVVCYGLGSLQKGGIWLVDNHNSFRACDNIILNCRSCEEIFNRLIRNNSLKMSLIPFGVDTNVFKPAADKYNIRDKYGISHNSFLVVYSGRINHQKNPMMLLSVFRDLGKKYDNLTFMFVGSFDDFYIPDFYSENKVGIKKMFTEKAEEWGLSSKLIMFETQNDMNRYAEILSMADIGVNITTLISENFGYTPVEMQASGLPVIGTSWGGLKDTIKDSVSGYKIETVHSRYGSRINYEQLKNRIEKLINDEYLRKEMSINARINVENNFSKKIFAENLHNIIKDTYDDFCYDSTIDDYFIDQSVENMSVLIHKKYGYSRHVSWEHLHPNLDKRFYDNVASKCADIRAEEKHWELKSVISKGFDWEVINDNIISNDSHWNISLELNECCLDDEEMIIMKEIVSGETFEQLQRRTCMSSLKLFDILCKLTEKGFIIPWNEFVPKNETAAFIIPFYGIGLSKEIEWLDHTLKSIEEQSDNDWKIIIVDDASIDEVSLKYLDSLYGRFGSRIEIIKLTENKGPGNARNVGIKYAAILGCPFVMYLDSDDIADSKRLAETRKAFVKHNEVGVVYSYFKVIDEDGNNVPDERILPSIREILEQISDTPPQGKGVWRKIALETGYVNLTSTTSVRTSIALKHPFPDERVSEDYYTWLIYSATGWEYMYLSNVCARYRIPQNNSGSRSRRMVGGNHEFNLRKSYVDANGFKKALELACENNEIKSDDKNLLLFSFYNKKAESMRKDGEDDIAKDYIKKANEIIDTHSLKYEKY